jgi:hypothetical protein
MTVGYTVFLFNLSYCKFKLVLFVSLLYLAVCLVSELREQNSLSIEALAALPPHLKFLLASTNKNPGRVIFIIVAGVIAKYHH